MRYTLEQFKALLRSVGFPEYAIDTMARIGILESNGDPTVSRVCPGNGRCAITRNGRTSIVAAVPGQAPESSYGLFQINRNAHPQYPASILNNPIANAKAALDIFNKQGYNAWKMSYGKLKSGFSVPNVSSVFPSAPVSSAVTFDSSVSVIGNKNRYLIAFFILVLIFIFAFKN